MLILASFLVNGISETQNGKNNYTMFDPYNNGIRQAH